MKVYINKHGSKVILSDLAVQSDGKQLLTVGFPCFRFDLVKGEELENSLFELLQAFGIKHDGSYEMELRTWPRG